MTKKKRSLASNVSAAMQRQRDIETYSRAPVVMTSEDEAIKTRALPEVIVYGRKRRALKDKVLGLTPISVSDHMFRVIDEVRGGGIPSLKTLINPTNKVFKDEGQAFLKSYKDQEEYLKTMGYHKVEDRNFGLVDNAARRLERINNTIIPIYQRGEDDISRDSLEVVSNTAWPHNSGADKSRMFNHPGDYPYAIYKKKGENKYYKADWDLNDYGNYDNEGGITYDNMQKAANLYDKIGHPFVVRSGIYHLPNYDNVEWDYDKGDFKKRNGGRKSLETIKML